MQYDFANLKEKSYYGMKPLCSIKDNWNKMGV